MVISTKIQKYEELWEHRGGACHLDRWSCGCQLERDQKGAVKRVGGRILGREANVCEGPE